IRIPRISVVVLLLYLVRAKNNGLEFPNWNLGQSVRPSYDVLYNVYNVLILCVKYILSVKMKCSREDRASSICEKIENAGGRKYSAESDSCIYNFELYNSDFRHIRTCEVQDLQ
ncbi:hypothetical protein, partial [Enterobacter cloacae complex sp. CH23B]|uniref:hypothetical protein n=1 Tax=Enterobacter cloacae complex sp. CH23B TaxID=2511986 RepID=UPI001CA5B44E